MDVESLLGLTRSTSSDAEFMGTDVLEAASVYLTGLLKNVAVIGIDKDDPYKLVIGYGDRSVQVLTLTHTNIEEYLSERGK